LAAFLILTLCNWGHDDDDDDPPPPPPPPAPTETVEVTPTPTPTETEAPASTETPINATPEISNPTSTEYMNAFFANSSSSRLKLLIPEYAYFQGIIYSKGNFTASGPLRILGGVVAIKGSGLGANITLEKGAMLTTDPEYLKSMFEPSYRNYRIVEWKEVEQP